MNYMNRPYSRADHNKSKVMLTLLHIWEKEGRVTMREVSQGAGLSLSCTYTHLEALRDEGLVTWENGTFGTLRPLVEVVR